MFNTAQPNNPAQKEQGRARVPEVDPLLKTKHLVLHSIIQISEVCNIDKTSEAAFRILIKKIELEEGLWEQIYAYFNVGVWYMKKTYFDKSVKSFCHCYELLSSHKKNSAEVAVFKANCLYNMALGYWSQGEQISAINTMQQCYRTRMNGIGKNSIECSECLYNLAKWSKDMGKWGECLQYLEECHRIRKLYQAQGAYTLELAEAKKLIVEVYEMIKRQKKASGISSPTSEKPHSENLEPQLKEEESSNKKSNELLHASDHETDFSFKISLSP
jgi:tetratricopeptide (TPR) repeat protein